MASPLVLNLWPPKQVYRHKRQHQGRTFQLLVWFLPLLETLQGKHWPGPSSPFPLLAAARKHHTPCFEKARWSLIHFQCSNFLHIYNLHLTTFSPPPCNHGKANAAAFLEQLGPKWPGIYAVSNYGLSQWARYSIKIGGEAWCNCGYGERKKMEKTDHARDHFGCPYGVCSTGQFGVSYQTKLSGFCSFHFDM